MTRTTFDRCFYAVVSIVAIPPIAALMQRDCLGTLMTIACAAGLIWFVGTPGTKGSVCRR